MDALPARFIQHVGTTLHLLTSWTGGQVCTSGYKHHSIRVPVGTSEVPNDQELGGNTENFNGDPRWPTACDQCGALVPVHAHRTLLRRMRYDTMSGDPEPCDLFYMPYGCARHEGKCMYGWDNCDGQHLIAVLPNGRHWDIDSRASNCTLPNDRLHRCWRRHGTPPMVHVDKDGLTCAAGAGSIAVEDYHGFLHYGRFVRY